ncbi:uncharacterized protein DFL_005762 [Arthrobotrys flagrans]|uniref:Uncharacterized protein n=1 Tax=Arthrobotrys flagrans TaxID=97331 RepID=A0A436ZZ10_ARTFL|nr:hypothetical protein DFL_005762 [Arthrobotrys flagrans]
MAINLNEQPDIEQMVGALGEITTSIGTVATELRRLLNIPAMADSAILLEAINGLRTDFNSLRMEFNGNLNSLRTEVNRNLNGIRTEVNGLRTEVNSLRTDIKNLNTEVQLGPMRMYNATASNGSTLKFPDGVRLQTIIPIKDTIYTLNLPQCRDALTQLSLTYERNEGVQVLRKRIREYLGAW